MNDVPKLPIDLAALKEMEKIAITNPVPGIASIPEYATGQQVMVIAALIKYLESFGIEANFELKI